MTIANKPTNEELRHWYVDLDLTQTQIAAKLGIAQNTVKHWLKVAGIVKSGTTRSGGGNRKRVGWLADAEATATTLDCDEIDPATMITTANGSRPNNEELRRLRIEERMSYPQIAARFGVPTSTVKIWCRTAGLIGAAKAARAWQSNNIVIERLPKVERTQPLPPLPAGWVRGNAVDFMNWVARRKERMMA